MTKLAEYHRQGNIVDVYEITKNSKEYLHSIKISKFTLMDFYNIVPNTQEERKNSCDDLFYILEMFAKAKQKYIWTLIRRDIDGKAIHFLFVYNEFFSTFKAAKTFAEYGIIT